jgi:hypothetical protein
MPLFGKRIDLAFMLLTVALIAVIATGWSLYVTYGDREGWFDSPIVQGIEDQRILTNVRDELDTRSLLDAVVHLPEDRLFVAQAGGDFHVYDPVTHLWSIEDAFTPTDPVDEEFVALRSGCGAERGTALACLDADSLWALGDDGSLARRTSGDWEIVIANTAFLGADGNQVESADLTSAALSDDARWLLLGTRDNGVGLYDTTAHRWLPDVTMELNAELARAAGTLPLMKKIVFWRGYFWAATPVGLFRLSISEDDPVLRYGGITGNILDLDRDKDVRLWVLEQRQCANIPAPTQTDCTWLGEFTSPDQSPRAVIDEENRYASADLANLFFAQQQDDVLVLAGVGGLYTYNTRLHRWEHPYPDADVNAVLPFKNGDGFYFSYGTGVGMYRTDIGVHVEPLQTLAVTEHITQLIDGDLAAEVIVITEDVMPGLGSVYALNTETWSYSEVHRRNRTSVDTDGGDGTQFDPATFTRALAFNDTAIFFAPEGLTLHDTRRQHFSDLVVEQTPEWLLDINTRLVTAGDVVFALTDRSAGADGDIYVLPADALATRDYFVNQEYQNATFFDRLPTPFVRWWRWDDDRMGFLGSDSSVYRVAADGVSQITGDAAGLFDSAHFLDVATTPASFYMATGSQLWRYDLNERRLSYSNLTVNAEEILFEGQTLYTRTSDGHFADQQGNGIDGDLSFTMGDDSLNDALAQGNLLYLAGGGVVEAYNLDQRRIVEVWDLHTQGNAVLDDIVDGQPLTLVGGRAILGDTVLAANAGQVTSLSHDEMMIWTVRQDTEHAYIMGHPINAPTDSAAAMCYFRQPSAGADVTEVLDARSLPNGAVIVLTDAGVKAYNPAARSWSNPSSSVRTAERMFYLQGVDGDYLLLIAQASDGFDLTFAPIADIDLPHSCDADARLRMSVSDPVRVRDYTVDETTDRAAWVLANGEVDVWQNGQTSVVLADVTNVDTTAFRRVFDRAPSGYLLFATANELWRYNLLDRRWEQIRLTISSDSAQITDLNVERDSANEIVTAHDAAGVPYFGAYDPTGRPSVTLRPILDTVSLTVSGMDAESLLDVQDRASQHTTWTFVLDDQVLYYDPVTRVWTRSMTFPADASRQFLRVPDRGIIEADGGNTWWIASDTGDHPTNFVAYARTATDQQEAITTTAGDVWRLDESGTVLRCRVVSGSECSVIRTNFYIDPNTVEYAINWTNANAVIFATTRGLRWFDVPLGTETALPDAAAHFTNLAGSLYYEDELFLYSDRDDSLLVMTEDGSATLNSVTDFRTDVQGRPWALFADGWRPYVNRQFALIAPSGVVGFRLFVGWNSPVAGIDAEGVIYLWDKDRLMREALPIPPQINPADVDFVVRESNGNYWILANDQLYHALREQCAAPDQLFPFSTAVAISTATESVRATEVQLTAYDRATSAAATAQPLQTEGALTAQAAADAALTHQALTLTGAADSGRQTATALAELAWTEEATLDVNAPTPTASETPTPTYTPTPSDTPTSTLTPTSTFTPTPTFTFTPTYTPSPEPIPCLYIAHEPFAASLTDIVSASSLVDGAVQFVDFSGTVLQASLNQPSPSVTVDPALIPVYQVDDDWGTLQANMLTLPNGTTAYDPVAALTIDGDGSMFAQRVAGTQHPFTENAVLSNRMELPPVMDAGWLRWQREDGTFIVNTGSGAQSFSPQQLISDGQLLFESVNRVIALREDRFQAANVFGLWEYQQPNLSLLDPTIRYFPQEIALPITAAHGMFMSNGRAYTTSASPQPVQRYQFVVDDVQFAEQPDIPTVAVAAPINGVATNALTASGFLWDVNRRGIAFDGGTLLLQSDMGVHSTWRLAAFDAGPSQLGIGNGILEGDSAGSAYLLDPVLRTWYQLQGGNWSANVPDPHQNRILLTTGMWNWALQGGVLQIALGRDPFAFSFSTRDFGFNFDRLRGAAVFGGTFYVMTDAFFEVGASGQIGFLQTGRSAPLDTERLDTVRFADGPRLYRFTGGNAYRWDNAAIQFTLEGFDPERDRPLMAQDRLRFTLTSGYVHKEARFDEFSGGSTWITFEFTQDQRFPFDQIFSTQQFDQRLYLGSALGLQEYFSPSSVGWSSLTALYRFAAESTNYEAVTRVGIPETDPTHILAQSDSVCAERFAGARFSACSDPSQLDRRVRVDTPLWRWIEVQDSGVIGRYYTAAGILDTLNIDGAGGRFPHDRITDAIVCGGQAYSTWEDRWISVYASLDMTLGGARNFALETAPTRFLCFEQAVNYADASIASGTYYQDQSGDIFLLSGQGWRLVTDARVLARLEEYTAHPPVFERNRARFLPSLSGTGYTFEQRGLDDEWRVFPWLYDPVTITWSPDIDYWNTVVRVGDQYWAATRGGLVNFYRDAAGAAYLDLDNLIVIREPMTGEFPCQVSDLLAESETVYARCNQNSEQVYSGVVTLTADMDIFELYGNGDPFAEERWIDFGEDRERSLTSGYWQWTMLERSDGETGRLTLEYSGDRTTPDWLSLQNGRFAFDTLDSLAVFYPERLEVATTQGGWFTTPRDSMTVSDFTRPAVGDYNTYTHVHLTRVPQQGLLPNGSNDNEIRLCVQTTDGTYMSYLLSGPDHSHPPCDEYLGPYFDPNSRPEDRPTKAETLWSYVREGDSVSITAPFSIGGPAARTLVNGRFADDTVIGLPITGGGAGEIRYWVPTQAGVIEFNGLMRGTTIHSGSFRGLEDGEVPAALLALGDTRPTYWGSGTLYALDDNRDPVLTLVADEANIVTPSALQSAPNDTIRMRWTRATDAHWLYFQDETAALSLDRLEVDIADFPRYLQHRADWTFSTTTITFDFTDTSAAVSIGDESLCLINLPADFTLIDAFAFEPRILLIGTNDMQEINLDPLIMAILNGTCRS